MLPRPITPSRKVASDGNSRQLTATLAARPHCFRPPWMFELGKVCVYGLRPKMLAALGRLSVSRPRETRPTAHRELQVQCIALSLARRTLIHECLFPRRARLTRTPSADRNFRAQQAPMPRITCTNRKPGTQIVAGAEVPELPPSRGCRPLGNNARQIQDHADLQLNGHAAANTLTPAHWPSR